ncbi:Uncharacterized membrane protein [Ruminococcaceae bacterium YRB3002]|nr:Uncharacterized membrane protein [Ruminococcaceae bacterium YRB3002]
MSRKSDTRAYELDTLRGLAMVFVIWMHISWDLRYLFGLAECSYLLAPWFEGLVHPFFLVIFVGVSGVCCTFSRSNVKRGLKLISVALALTAGTAVATYAFGFDCLIVFNVLHLLSVGIFIYALVELLEKKFSIPANKVNVLLGLIGVFAIILGMTISNYDYKVNTPLLIPTGIMMECTPSMADYMPLFPWIGVFMVGALTGRVCYHEKKTVVPPKSDIVRRITAPLEFIGRHSLLIYIVHQPVVLLICYLLSLVAGK